MATSNGSFSFTRTVGIQPSARKGAQLYQNRGMLILGIESSCDETGVALYDGAEGRLLAHVVHSQVAMHEAYGGVVPELASRDHIRRLVPLTRLVLERSGHGMAELS